MPASAPTHVPRGPLTIPPARDPVVTPVPDPAPAPVLLPMFPILAAVEGVEGVTRAGAASRDVDPTAGSPPAPPSADPPGRASRTASQLQSARLVETQIGLARAAGVPEARIQEITAEFDPDGPPGRNRRIADALRRARLRELGYDVGMRRDEYTPWQYA